jgi:type VI secretion system protein ImpI/type VI secretion system protein
MVIGRSTEADWMIPDPERVISKAHCRIDRTARGFMLTDTSTNGIRINEVPVGRGLPSLLSDGDVLKLGDAIIGVEVLASPQAHQPAPMESVSGAAAPAEANAEPAEAPTGAPSSPFADGPFGFDETLATATTPMAKEAASEPVQAAADGPLLQDWWDPNAASGKPGLPLSADGAPESAMTTPAVPAAEQVSSSLQANEEQTLSRAAGGVDGNTLLQAVETAAQVLSKDEREKFERRLRDILQAEHRR